MPSNKLPNQRKISGAAKRQIAKFMLQGWDRKTATEELVEVRRLDDLAQLEARTGKRNHFQFKGRIAQAIMANFDYETAIELAGVSYKQNTPIQEVINQNRNRMMRPLRGKELLRFKGLLARGYGYSTSNNRARFKQAHAGEGETTRENGSQNIGEHSGAPSKAIEAINEEDLDPHLTLAVLNRAASDGSMSVNRWRLICMELLKVFKSVLADNPGPPPRCNDLHWLMDKVKIIICTDERSADLFKNAFSRIDQPWDGAQLEVVEKQHIEMAKYKTTLPPVPATAEEAMQLIAVSNPDLNTENWEIEDIAETDIETGDRHVFIFMDTNSLVAVKKLKGIISYGFSSLNLKLMRKGFKLSNK